ncbi:MAG TPA: aspartate-semialdehyde dehydrogenase [Gemmatimonadaceae bacterium]|nr:aspartate-semialdehyde dehydrogenase [Gemmatimonadaceae bacterium]
MMTVPQRSIPVAVLGATGAVGQTFIRLLAAHPWFRLTEVAASARSAGKSYAEAAHWISGSMPDDAARLPVVDCDPDVVSAPIVFSALDSSVAGDVEQAFARAGRLVLTNARNHRMDADVPLVIPEVNADHLGLLATQRARRRWTGGIVANGNCAAIVVTMALAPLQRAFGIEHVFVATLQAVSGAGYPGVPTLDILANVIPFIGGGEEEKIETETPKMLGTLRGEGIEPAPLRISAQVHRVPVENGHTASMAITLGRRAAPSEVHAVLTGWRSAIADRALPSAPGEPLVLVEEHDRPQPRHDAGRGGGMTVSVGRLRADPIGDVRMVACGHNTVRGAAGASILNAELLVADGWLPDDGAL